tara:strand:- start:545 stop:1102 length:558 start_codon:yes stop_codon:yes gene_type:complete
MGLTSPIGECLGAPDETFSSFFDPIVEGMAASIKPVKDIVCIIIEADADLLLTVPDLVASLALDLGEWVTNPLSLIELAGLDLPNILLGLDISGEINIDPEFTLAAIDMAIGLLLIPLDIIAGWIDGLTSLELPSIPTLDDISLLLEPLGFILPEGKLGECVAQLPLIPLQAIGDIISGDTSPCA